MPVHKLGELISDPQKLTRHLIKVVGMALILTALAMAFLDQSLSAFFGRGDIRGLWYEPARTLTDAGLFEVYFVIALGTWSFTKWIAPRWESLKSQPQKIEFFRRWSLNFLAALIVCGILTHILKFSVGRQRPHKSPDFDPYVFSPFTTHWHWHSFASGHSQVMFTAATMMSLAFPKWRWLWLSFAALVCFTRVMVYDHFLSDIIFGACVGYVGTLLTLYLMRTKTQNGLS